ncbi:hypothetical protein JZ751_016481 [Albula glossodonta]|uniref:Uncharacterized protein n=1 Tax=Albula glossodonta TaxID=121402 RepID=A0A8T2NYF7_9TELE|nr:hypothetical protein JZ751_016481 [Albula glossodonta]
MVLCDCVLYLVHVQTHAHTYLRLPSFSSKASASLRASSFQRLVVFCWAVSRRLSSTVELRLPSSNSRTRASSPCSFTCWLALRSSSISRRSCWLSCWRRRRSSLTLPQSSRAPASAPCSRRTSSWHRDSSSS